MDQEEPEMGRFEPKGNPNEPREPFYPHKVPKSEKPSLAGLHLPQGQLDSKKLKAVLMELPPIVEHVQELSREDQHVVGTYLQGIKEDLHSGDFNEELVRAFEKVVDHYNDLLMHSHPKDQDAALENIKQLLSKL